MNLRRSTNFLGGSPGFRFETRKLPNNRYEITCPSHPDRKWEADDEVEGMQNATREMQDALLRGELGNTL